MFYQPEEDSKLLLKEILLFLKKSNNKKELKNILEIGTGSGYILTNIIKQLEKQTPTTIKYWGTDINPHAITNTKKQIQQISKQINHKIIEKNLYPPKTKQKYDLILFNPPYLPLEKNEKIENLKTIDKALYGGKKGNEITLQFLEKLNENLNEKGTCFLLICSLSKPEEIYKYLNENLYNYKITNSKNFFFEKLISLQITKTQLLQELNNNKKLKKIKYYTKGKHSTILQAIYTQNNKTQKVIIKTGHENFISKETLFLKKLKNKPYIPKLYLTKTNYIILEKLEAQTIQEFLKDPKNTKTQTIQILNQILKTTQDLDKLKINKFEFTNPYKHIFITKTQNKNAKTQKYQIKLIDFERSIFKQNPKNTRQFLQYLNSKNITQTLQTKNITISKQKTLKISQKLKKQTTPNSKLTIKINDIIK